MRFELHADGRTATPKLREYIAMCLAGAFRRTHHRVRRVSVFLWDVNGPRGGVDQGVRMIVELIPTGEILVRETAANPFVAVSQAAARARQAVRNELQKRRARRRRAGRRPSVVGSASAEATASSALA